MRFQQSKTWRNLQQACEGELRASARYRLWAGEAGAEGLLHIRGVFAEAADHESVHAALWQARLRAGEPPCTQANLRMAAAGEFAEWADLYRRFGEEARQEGYQDIARQFDRAAAVARRHNQRFCELADELAGGLAFQREEETAWGCLRCGHVELSRSAPRECPLCGGGREGFAAAR